MTALGAAVGVSEAAAARSGRLAARMLRYAAMPKARTQARVCLIGLDSVPPALVFHKFWPHLPHLRRLATAGGAGVLASCDPPITVPAWATMMTGHDPGTLGLYGFQDRVSSHL